MDIRSLMNISGAALTAERTRADTITANLETLIGGLGIGNDDHVIIVPAGVNAVDFGSATRVYWTFKILGHDKVSILDGGYALWEAQGRTLESGSNRRAPKTFEARYRPVGEPRYAEPGSLEEWLTERYCLYAANRGRVTRAEVHHVRWPLRDAFAPLAQLPRDACMPPCAALECERFGGTRLRIMTSFPYDEASMAARSPARPAPTTSTSVVMVSTIP